MSGRLGGRRDVGSAQHVSEDGVVDVKPVSDVLQRQRLGRYNWSSATVGYGSSAATVGCTADGRATHHLVAEQDHLRH